LLDFGRRHAISDQAQAAYDASIAGYRQTVLSAFQEVEDNLAALRILKQEADEQDVATKSAENSLALEMDGYKEGIYSYLDVVVVQNIALTNERASVQILGRRMVAAVTLISALGGGWDSSQLPWPNNMKSPPPTEASTPPSTTSPIVSSSTSTVTTSPTNPK
jgi:outer membrane protein TolC